MIRYLSLGEVLEIYQRVMDISGGAMGIRDLNALESSIVQPRMTFGQQDLYPTLAEKAAALAYALILNHPFVDGNKRVGHAAMEVFLMLNGFEIVSSVDEQENIILQVAAGEMDQRRFAEWVNGHIRERGA